MLVWAREPLEALYPELLGVLGREALPGVELHRVCASDAADGSSAQKPIKNVEGNVPARGAPGDETAIDLMPQRQARAAGDGFELPAEIAVLQQRGRLASRHLRCQRRGRGHT